MPLQIGIDIRKYFDYGIGTYIQEILREYQNDDDLACTYFAQPQHLDLLKNTLRGKVVAESSGLYSVSELFLFAKHINTSRISLFHEPHYTLPFRLKIPSVVTIHDIIHIRLKQYFSVIQRLYAYNIIRHACYSSSAIIVNSHFTKSELLNHFDVDDTKIFVTYLGIPSIFNYKVTFETKEAFLKKYKLTTPYIFYAGALKPHKNIPVLLKAFSRVRKNFNINLVLAGELLSQYPSLQQLVQKLEIESCVYSIGKIPQEALCVAYQTAELYVLPSQYEGFGIPLVEAMASGVPVIASNATAIPEILGDCGLLFEPADELDLEKKINILLSDLELRNKCTEKGKQRSQLFSYKQCAQQTKEIYKKILQ